MSVGRMTMRAVVSRSPAQPADDWGRPGPPIFAQVGNVPCFAWSKMRREYREEGKFAVVEDLRALVPRSADVQEGDRLSITDRMGTVLFGGPVAVQTVAAATPGYSSNSHRVLMLQRHV